jgi:hypothetical protein
MQLTLKKSMEKDTFKTRMVSGGNVGVALVLDGKLLSLRVLVLVR